MFGTRESYAKIMATRGSRFTFVTVCSRGYSCTQAFSSSLVSGDELISRVSNPQAHHFEDPNKSSPYQINGVITEKVKHPAFPMTKEAGF